MRYRAIAEPVRGDWWDYARGTDFAPRTIHEVEKAPVATGLLDANGIKLYRMPERNPFGFVALK